ncbi:hypothetical protein Nos7524_3927 [Nostoc sp. PCC 7524]|uniref:hypothetical protein n=1 Tax=Nostoc sp. (strain ATCC 29411 / PCC 7524) TaxID=28072 RepID=UPI00029F2277|nr:hypothetical protein [Nostoc sp. PCC 7524]AFY49700.1 hypothetical protein Nos7524_3927 [Nostoc sp. PCC 7524]
MQIQGWKRFLFAILLATIGTNTYCTRVNAAWSKNANASDCRDNPEVTANHVPNVEISDDICPKNKLKPNNSQLQQFEMFDVASAKQIALNKSQPQLITAQVDSPAPNPTPTENPHFVQQTNESPQLETQPNNLPQITPKPIDQLLNAPPVNRTERLERLIRRLRETKQPSSESDSYRELGLRVRPIQLPQSPLEQPQIPQRERPVQQFKPIGSLQARVGYFYSSNIFSSDVFPIEEGLFFYGLRLASVYFPLGDKTYLNGSIDGNLIRYLEQSKFNYNQIRFNVGIYQQLSQRMYGELGWSNQQLFYAKNSDVFTSGDRFLNENSFRLSLGRRDPLTDKLMLDSFYELSWNLADPDRRSRIINSIWLSLNYSLQKPLEVGLNYQLNISDFTQRDRHDHYHRLFAHLIYRLSQSSSLNLQTGVSFGDSTAKNLDFNSWFFNVNYNVLLGEF